MFRKKIYTIWKTTRGDNDNAIIYDELFPRTKRQAFKMAEDLCEKLDTNSNYVILVREHFVENDIPREECLQWTFEPVAKA